MPNKTGCFYEFGPFRLDPTQRQLFRQHDLVPLQPKAFDILLVLVENPQQVVLKDDLMKAVWPDTFVEESNLSQHIFVLRKTLGAGEEGKRYIITVPGRGYRFAEAVRTVAGEELPAAKLGAGGELDLTADIGDKEDPILVTRRALATVTVQKERLNPLWLGVVAATVVAVIGLAIGLLWRSQRKSKLTEKDTIVLSDFENKTGDPVFDGTLRQGLSAQLEQSPFLNLLSDARIAQTLALMTQPKGTRLSPELARQVCQRTESAAVLDGTVAQIGARYLLTLKASDCSTGESLASTEAQAIDKDQVLDALGKVATEIRGKLGESLASVQKYDVPLENVTTSSLEALQAETLGRRAETMSRPEAILLYKRAISLDPDFAMPYVGAAVHYFNHSENSRAAEYLQKAYELRQRVSEHERLNIEVLYEYVVLGDCGGAFKSEVLYTQIYTRDTRPYGNLGAFASCLGEYETELSATQQAVRFNPGAKAYANLIVAYLHLNRLNEALSTGEDAKKHNMDSHFAHDNLYLVAFLRGDTQGMEQEVRAASADNPEGDLIFYNKSDTAAYGGHFVEARELTRRASDVALRSDAVETAAEYRAESALREALVGNLEFAKVEAKEALAQSNGRGVAAMSGMALGLAKDFVDSMRLADDLSKRFPQNTIVQYNSLPSIRAATALGGGDPAKAVAALAAATTYEFGQAGQNVSFALYPVYLRGMAYLAAKRGAEAAAEFQKIMDHPGLVVNEPIGALAHLGLGRAYLLSQDAIKAKTEYQNFLTVWGDADPNIPVLKQAKAEYAEVK
jgi:eukaryotic-like serine/threonine-protein kinase